MRRLTIVLNAMAVAVLLVILVRYLLVPLVLWLVPFAMALMSLTRSQIASFHMATIITNLVTLLFGVLALSGLGEDAFLVDSTWQELLTLIDVLFFLLTPLLNLYCVWGVMRTESAPTRPE
jgi:hypothetical protein